MNARNQRKINSKCKVFNKVLQEHYFFTDVGSTTVTYFVLTQSPYSGFTVSNATLLEKMCLFIRCKNRESQRPCVRF